MKKYYFSLIAVFSAITFALLSNPSSVRGQLLTVKYFPPSDWVSIRAGLTIPSESLSPLPGGAAGGLMFGFTGGIDFEHWFNEKWGIKTGVSEMRTGIDQQYAPSSTEFPNVTGDDNFSLNFIEVPLLIKRAVPVGDDIPFLSVGPIFGFLNSSSETANGTIQPLSDLKSYFEEYSISLYFGAGVTHRFSQSVGIFFDAGYETGLTGVWTTEPERQFLMHVGQTSATTKEGIFDIGLTLKL